MRLLRYNELTLALFCAFCDEYVCMPSYSIPFHIAHLYANLMVLCNRFTPTRTLRSTSPQCWLTSLLIWSRARTIKDPLLPLRSESLTPS